MLRQIEDKDWPVVNKWMIDMASESFDKVIPSILEKKIQEDYRKEPEGFIVSEDGQKLNGLLWFSTIPEKKTAFIHAIHVEPDYRGKGVSDSLMDYLEQYCADHNIETMELNVTTNMKHAIKFYERKGFDIKRYTMGKKIE